MRYSLVFILTLLLLGLGINEIYSQTLSNQNCSIDLRLGIGNIITPRFSIPTEFHLDPSPFEMTESDFPRLEIAPSFNVGVELETRMKHRLRPVLGVFFFHSKIRGRLGAIQSRIEFPITESLTEIIIPLGADYSFPVGKRTYEAKLGTGIAANYAFPKSIRHGASNDLYALLYKVRKPALFGLKYYAKIELNLPWNKSFFSIGMTSYFGTFSPIRLEVEHYKLDDPSDVMGNLSPDKMTYGYWQKITPHQILLFVNIPILSR